MIRFTFAIAAVLFVSAPAFAADDIMLNTYGNTVVGKSPVFESHTHYRPDHTFDATYMSAMGGTLATKGTWEIDASGQLCRTFETPPPGSTNPLCILWSAHNISDTWQATGAGVTVEVTLVKGVI